MEYVEAGVKRMELRAVEERAGFELGIQRPAARFKPRQGDAGRRVNKERIEPFELRPQIRVAHSKRGGKVRILQ